MLVGYLSNVVAALGRLGIESIVFTMDKLSSIKTECLYESKARQKLVKLSALFHRLFALLHLTL